jgi:glycerol kinase
MQFQADMLGVPVLLPQLTETTALGAAYLAGIGIGMWTVSAVAEHWRERCRFEPQISADQRGTLLAGWHRAVERAVGWVEA